ncbi:AsnC family transcriptional regulator [Halorhabdus sp. CBA1104]|uniref:AsnC family transcriptional regulator n=1 Tax=Halorhabdus sp. CBA1104 TaxID=1380432 RepID=UPI0012B2B96A|nr:AsnC family transcriptional regulator [Halorhabdus sp. CBA1104]QGN07039.1 AsnC family transcriptional regulator [Halorhabdus sp. CBA1104]
MRGLDDTDREILHLLLEDARRPYSDIAEQVDLSAPAVSDRVDRLREMGLIERFTLDVDRSMLREGTPVLIELTPQPEATGISGNLAGAAAVEHVFRTADGTVLVVAHVDRRNVRGFLGEQLDLTAIDAIDVRMLADSQWTPQLGAGELAPACAECGNTVTSEGETATLDGDVYHFCCPSCQSKFVDRYEELAARAE